MAEWTFKDGGLSDDEIKRRGLKVLPGRSRVSRPARSVNYDLDLPISTPGWDYYPNDDKDKRRFE